MHHPTVTLHFPDQGSAVLPDILPLKVQTIGTCPECRAPVTGNTVLRDSCGHVKCKKCFAENFLRNGESCPQCLRESKSVQNNSSAHIPVDCSRQKSVIQQPIRTPNILNSKQPLQKSSKPSFSQEGGVKQGMGNGYTTPSSVLLTTTGSVGENHRRRDASGTASLSSASRNTQYGVHQEQNSVIYRVGSPSTPLHPPRNADGRQKTVFGFDFNGVTVCPECKLAFNPPLRRPVKEFCGHIKCWKCYVGDAAIHVENCTQCHEEQVQRAKVSKAGHNGTTSGKLPQDSTKNHVPASNLQNENRPQSHSECCPECGVAYNKTDRRLVRETCGHAKCRKCFVDNSALDLECIQCCAVPKESSNLNVEAAQKPGKSFMPGLPTQHNKSKGSFNFTTLRRSVSGFHRGIQQKSQQCLFCSMRFKKPKNPIATYCRVHSHSNNRKCEFCSETFASGYQLKCHKTSKGSYCGTRYQTKTYTCKTCGRGIVGFEEFHKHSATHRQGIEALRPKLVIRVQREKKKATNTQADANSKDHWVVSQSKEADQVNTSASEEPLKAGEPIHSDQVNTSASEEALKAGEPIHCDQVNTSTTEEPVKTEEPLQCEVPSSFPCGICFTIFGSREDLSSHLTQAHYQSQEEAEQLLDPTFLKSVEKTMEMKPSTEPIIPPSMKQEPPEMNPLTVPVSSSSIFESYNDVVRYLETNQSAVSDKTLTNANNDVVAMETLTFNAEEFIPPTLHDELEDSGFRFLPI